MKTKVKLWVLATALFLAQPAAAEGIQKWGLPEGVWVGSITSRTIPDVDKDGEWEDQIRLSNCKGKVVLSFRLEDGRWGSDISLSVVPLHRQYLLIYSNTGSSEKGRWMESQVWTLADATPAKWPIAQSRSVVNPDSGLDEPWRTFQRFAWGAVEYEPNGCTRL
jgi:hypothetical protein